MTNFSVGPHCYAMSCQSNSKTGRLPFGIMPSSTTQHDRIYYEASVALSSSVEPFSVLFRYIRLWQSSFSQFMDVPGTVMEESSSSSAPTEPQTATSFTKFGDLPPELRLKIWEFALPDARTVVVKSPYIKSQRTPASLDNVLSQAPDEHTWRSTTQIPAPLHVNSEARYEALKHYSLSLSVGDAQPRVYIDFDRDTLFFGDAELRTECLSLWSQTKDLDKVQRLAIVPEGAWRALRWKGVDIRSLKKLIFVHECENVKLGRLPQLVEDETSETGSNLGLLHLRPQTRRLETSKTGSPCQLEVSAERMRAAIDELNTLKLVLPTEWENEPAVATAVFRESCGGTWVC